MKKLLLAGTVALLMPFTTTLYAANIANTVNMINTTGTTDTAKPDLDEIGRRFEKKAEMEAKEELKRLVQENELKKDLAASRGTQPNDTQTNNSDSLSERIKRAMNTTK
ncbi:hypothetical protein VU04_03870 [Desulfobulbus sp. TB]|nr:hypothetical protein [Desulfobulbus sp. TB]